MTETEALIILNAVDGIGNRKIPQLINHFGSAAKVLEAKESDLSSTRSISQRSLQSLHKLLKSDFLRAEDSLLKKLNARVIPSWDRAYPASLKHIPDKPVLLYCRGDSSACNELSLAIVGSRRASIYGMSIARKLAIEMSQYGVCVVSGMARGIDTSAHQGALSLGGSTVAVLGSGLSQIYPKENEGLFRQISENGCVVSEFPLQTPPLGVNFPRRNRIISGLSMGVIVVEAAKKSGALITADFALEQGKDVYAVPGQVDNPASKGVNNLIKQGAKLITGFEDVLEDLKPNLLMEISDVNFKERRKENVNDLTEAEQLVYKYITNNINFDIIINKTGMQASSLNSLLMHLELKGFIQKKAGSYFSRRKE